MFGEKPHEVANPAPGSGWNDEAEYIELPREVATLPLVTEPMSKAAFVRNIGVEGEWTGGAITIFSKTDALVVSSDINPNDSSWVKFHGKWYKVCSLDPYLDDTATSHVEYCALLMREQPKPADFVVED